MFHASQKTSQYYKELQGGVTAMIWIDKKNCRAQINTSHVIALEKKRRKRERKKEGRRMHREEEQEAG